MGIVELMRRQGSGGHDRAKDGFSSSPVALFMSLHEPSAHSGLRSPLLASPLFKSLVENEVTRFLL